MDLFGRRSRDPLLFDCEDRNEFDTLLGERNDCSYSKLDASGLGTDLDLDVLDPNTDLGSWLHNNSLSQLTSTLDPDNDTSLSEGNLLAVNPETIMPMQMPHAHQTHTTTTTTDSECVNSAAMRLHANCSDVINVSKALIIQHQQPTHIQLVAVPVATAAVSNSSNNTTPVNSPMKASTLVLNANTTFSVAGTTYIASPQKLTISSSQKTRNVLTPSQCSPVLVGHLQSSTHAGHQRTLPGTVSSPVRTTNFVHQHSQQLSEQYSGNLSGGLKQEEKVYPKPVFSYSCLIALALKNSKSGNLPVSEIYNFMVENFPYFKTAPDGWKNSVRHNLSLNKCFAKVDNPKLSSGAKKGCLWALNPAKIKKMEEEISKWGKKDPVMLLTSMAYPENLEAIEKGQAGLPVRRDDENCRTPSPSTPIKKEFPSTPKQEHEPANPQFDDDSQDSFGRDLMSEYTLHRQQWTAGDNDSNNDLHIDFVGNSPVLSPLASHSSPLPYTPSRSVHRSNGPAMYQGIFYTSSPVRLISGVSPSSVRTNLFGVVTPPRTLSAQN